MVLVPRRHLPAGFLAVLILDTRDRETAPFFFTSTALPWPRSLPSFRRMDHSCIEQLRILLSSLPETSIYLKPVHLPKNDRESAPRHEVYGFLPPCRPTLAEYIGLSTVVIEM